MVAPVVAAPITPDDGFAMETFVSVEKRGCCCSVLHEKSCENQPLQRTRSRRQAQPLHFSQRTRLLRRRELLSFILQSLHSHSRPPRPVREMREREAQGWRGSRSKDRLSPAQSCQRRPLARRRHPVGAGDWCRLPSRVSSIRAKILVM